MKLNSEPVMHYQLKKKSRIDNCDNENEPISKKIKEIYNYIYEDNFFYIFIRSKIALINRIDSKVKEVIEIL